MHAAVEGLLPPKGRVMESSMLHRGKCSGHWNHMCRAAAHLEHTLCQGRLFLAKQQLLDLRVQAGQPLVGLVIGEVDVAVCARAHDVELGIKHVDALRQREQAMSSLEMPLGFASAILLGDLMPCSQSTD